MQSARDDLLARPALPGHEDRHLGVRHAVDEIVDAPHRLALAYEVGRAPRAMRYLVLQSLDLLPQALVFHGAVDGDGEDVELYRLADEVVRTRADGLHCGLERPERGEDEDGDVRQ